MLDIKKLLAKILTMGVFKDASGNVSISGNITVGGHAGRIGGLTTIDKTETKASATTFSTLTDCTLSLSAGSWIITAYAEFAANATGIRAIRITQGSSGIVHTPIRQSATPSSTVSALQTVAMVQTTNPYTYALQVWQNSGSSLSVHGYLRAMRIS